MRAQRFVSATALGVLALAATAGACRSEPTSASAVVAEVGDRTITASEFEAYLSANLEGEVAGAALGPGDLERVRSRLFDTFLEEQILLTEALRRGIDVSDAEVDDYLDEPLDDSGEQEQRAEATSRETAKRNLMVVRLREGYVRSRAVVTPGEVEAYLEEHGESLTQGRTLVLRALAFDSVQEAEKARREIRRRRMTFDEAVVVWADAPGQGEQVEVTLESLPEPVQAAVRGLKGGEVTRPVTVQDNVYLFQVQTWTLEGKDRDRALWQRAYEELLRLRHEEASRALVSLLRKTIRVRTHPENLPFPYVPDQEPPDGPPGDGGPG